MVQQVYQVVADIRRDGTTALLVEQNRPPGALVADRGQCVGGGQLVASPTTY